MNKSKLIFSFRLFILFFCIFLCEITLLFAEDKTPSSPFSCPASFLDLTFKELEAREQTAVSGIAKLTLKLETGKIAYDTVEDVKNHLINTRIELRERLIRNYFKNLLTSDNNIELTNHLDLLVSDLIRLEIYKMQGRQDELLAQREAAKMAQQAQFEQSRLLRREYETLKGNDEFPLVTAAKNNEIERFKKLLSNPYTNPSETDEEGNSPLHMATLKGNEAIVKLIIFTPEFKTEQIVIGNENNVTALHFAAGSKYSNIFKMFLNFPDFNLEWLLINQKSSGNNSVHTAASNSISDNLVLIINTPGFKPEWLATQNNKKYNPFHLAAFMGFTENISVMSKAPGFIPEWLSIQSISGFTPLHAACQNGYTNTAQMIISTPGFKPEWLAIQNNNGDTALHLAANHENFNSTIELIIKKNGILPEILEIKNRHGETPFHLAALIANIMFIKIISKSPEFKPEWLIIKDNTGNTPLLIVSLTGNTKALSSIINTQGFKLEWLTIKNNRGLTSLHAVAMINNFNALKLVINLPEFNPDWIMIKNEDGKSVYDLAYVGGNAEMVELLQTKLKELESIQKGKSP